MNMLIFALLTLLSSIPLSFAVPPVQSPPRCTVTESSIFSEIETCGKVRSGSLTREDVTVSTFGIGRSTLRDVIQRFPKAKEFRLTKEEEAAKGVCVRNAGNQAVVFASGSTGGWDVLDSIYLGDPSIFERNGAKCLVVDSLSEISTESGIKVGMAAEDLLTHLHNATVHGSKFYINYSTSPDKAPWVSSKVKPTNAEGWAAMSGAMGAFKAGHLRWLVLYGAISD